MKELPRERLIAKGSQALASHELLAIILQTGMKNKSVLLFCQELLDKYSLEKLFSSSVRELSQIKGIGVAKACKLVAMNELVRRSQLGEGKTFVKSPEDVYNYFEYLSSLEQEECHVLYLNARQRVLKDELLFRGTLDSTVIHPREVFKSALRENVHSIIVVHNHPSGDPTPSEEDVAVTTLLKEAGTILGVNVLDHIIVGKGSYYSFEEHL